MSSKYFLFWCGAECRQNALDCVRYLFVPVPVHLWSPQCVSLTHSENAAASFIYYCMSLLSKKKKRLQKLHYFLKEAAMKCFDLGQKKLTFFHNIFHVTPDPHTVAHSLNSLLSRIIFISIMLCNSKSSQLHGENGGIRLTRKKNIPHPQALLLVKSL